MPDDPFDLEALRARQAEARAAAAAEHDDEDLRHLTKIEITNCQLCDDDGYRRPERTVVCDHIDRSETSRRGIARCREALQAKQLRLDDAAGVGHQPSQEEDA